MPTKLDDLNLTDEPLNDVEFDKIPEYIGVDDYVWKWIKDRSPVLPSETRH
jgi:hypothetical protein